MDVFEKRILAGIRENHLIAQGSTVITGVSGGADSVCLLRVLTALRHLLAIEICVVHIEHGLRGQLAGDPTWAAAWMDRMQRLVIRDRNHPSVVMWSLGNEAGWGPNFAITAAWTHEYDPTRPIHYEGAQGTGAEAYGLHGDPSSVDVISRFYPRTQDEYLNPGVKDNNMERPENARWERLLSIARDSSDQRPVLTSEYAHAMGNALGNFREYWDEIYSHPRMLGGFIWEWADEGIFTERDGKRMTAYGGDFGDAPNLKAFCLKGIVSSDRLPTPKYEEVKAVYSPIQFNDENGRVVPVLRDAHCDLSDYEAFENITSLGFGFLGTKKNDYGVTTPTYICIDDIVIEYEK